MNDTQLLERLSSAYATLEAPAPSAALAAVLEAGAVGEAHDDERRDAVVVPLVRPRPQTRLRVRHLVAAMVATFVLFSGLAVAGALPDPVQRQVSSVVSHLGIDLPTPSSGPAEGGSDAPRAPERQAPPSTTAAPGAATATTAPAGTGTPVAGADGTTPAPPSTTPAELPLGGVGDVGDLGGATGGGTVTTLPPTDTLLPPLTVPQLTLPPLSLPPVTLGPITITPLPLDLPLLGL